MPNETDRADKVRQLAEEILTDQADGFVMVINRNAKGLIKFDVMINGLSEIETLGHLEIIKSKLVSVHPATKPTREEE